MRSDTDVIVVGAGPAGATAARTLARCGCRVRLLERGRFPRNKPCGGGITTRALARFPWLGPALRRIPTHFISRLYLEAPGGRHVVLRSSKPAVVTIRRVEFDDLLARLAVESGAELVEEACVTRVRAGDERVEAATRDGRSFGARCLVAADGVNGIVTRRLGLHAGWDGDALALDLMEETPSDSLGAAEPGTLWVSYGHGGASGYGYVFPKAAHVNVGVGCLVSSLRERRPGAPYEIQRAFVDGLAARGVLAGASSRACFTPGHIPVGGPIRHTGLGRVVVAGDAGGFVNAYTAEGIYYAMVSGDLAGRAVAGALAGGPGSTGGLARRYAASWRREIGAELSDAVLVQQYLFRDARRIEGVVEGAAALPEVAQAIIALATGDLPYEALRRRLLRRHPRFAAALALLAAGRRIATGAAGPGKGL